MQISSGRPHIVAVLGPTNTGKTHLAMERMLAHESGMIGFPLRLLARENYDRAVKLRGKGQVALITGEEKILPPHARYFLCTVESMPVDRPVAFLGVDEIQMCADPDRGHIFTDRLLHARGTAETMFMGAETVKPLIRKLIPDASFESRPRFSTLTYTGARKFTRLPARSAVVAFSTADVYAIAEIVRRHRGGAAVVLGALSPRTRNAQVGMYQAGEVDYLVATDAIGMGLNMDIDHVAFAQTRKFDGRMPRNLTPAELGQIAGRAGRHMNDGTFGTTAEAEPFEPEVAACIETHTFEELRFLFWRNARLRYTSLGALKASLAQRPSEKGLVRARHADDELALEALSKDPELAARADNPETVALLWEICRIPDFGKVMSDAHTRLLARIFTHLTTGNRRLPEDWVHAQLKRIDRTDGDIETLAQRIANIRTWTYVSFRGNWLTNAAEWQARARAVEDKLSDALHDRLTRRFVDKRTTALVRRMKDREGMIAAVTRQGDVVVEGHFVGKLNGFKFVADVTETDPNAKRAVTSAALKALRGDVAARVARLEADPDDAFSLDGTGALLWGEDPIARLTAGAGLLTPAVEPLATDLLETEARERVRLRLVRWLDAWLGARLGPLLKARQADLSGPARGIVFQLAEGLGSARRSVLAPQIEALGAEGRRTLRKLGIRIGRESVFFPALTRPGPVEARCLLWSLQAGLAAPPAGIPAGRVSVPRAEGVCAEFYRAAGYVPSGRLAVRADIMERLADQAWDQVRKGPFPAGPELLNLAGCGAEDIGAILKSLGFQQQTVDGEIRFAPARRRKRPGPKGKDTRKAKPPRPLRPREADSPFAALRELVTPK